MKSGFCLTTTALLSRAAYKAHLGTLSEATKVTLWSFSNNNTKQSSCRQIRLCRTPPLSSRLLRPAGAPLAMLRLALFPQLRPDFWSVSCTASADIASPTASLTALS